MKDIKIKIVGNKTPSGMNEGVEYMIGEPKLKLLQADGRFKIEVIEKPKAKPKPKKKKVVKEEKGDE